MSYYINAEKVTLSDLLNRLRETDLVPSRMMLYEGIEENFHKLELIGILTMADLRKAVKNPKNIAALAQKTGIGNEYLTLLRREIEGYFPKACKLSGFNWLDKIKLETLESRGYKNAALLYEALETSLGREEVIKSTGLDVDFINEVFSLVDLTRIQWVSPLTARMLAEAGYRNAKSVAEANDEKLCRDIEDVNEKNKYFKGKVGLRDIKRLIKAASYLK